MQRLLLCAGNSRLYAQSFQPPRWYIVDSHHILVAWQLACIFMLHATTMSFGFLCEYISVPKAIADRTAYAQPVGYREVELWKKGQQSFTPNYHLDDTALKHISTDEWEGERPLYDIQDTKLLVGTIAHRGLIRQQRFDNYVRRMIPHALGYFPFITAWVVLITHLENAKADVAKISDRTIPTWVDGVIYGTVVIVSHTHRIGFAPCTHLLTLCLPLWQFWAFAIVQVIFQALPPTYYWYAAALLLPHQTRVAADCTHSQFAGEANFSTFACR